MGEWMTQVPVKLSPETVARLDLLRAAYPFKPGRSTVIRELVEEGLRLIAEGIMQFRAQGINRVPSVQSIPGTPSQISAAFPGEQKKPPVRRVIGDVASRGRITVNHRMASCTVMAVLEGAVAYRPLFLGKVSPFNSNTYARVA